MPQGPLLIVAGTRPEALKVAPLAGHLSFPLRWCWSDQQCTLPADVAALPWTRLPALAHPLSRPGLQAALARRLFALMGNMRPAAVLVQGDTATAYAGASAARQADIPVIHLEAGLRSGNPRAPFPEEIHRLRIARIAALHLAPSALARMHLLAEGVAARDIVRVGSTAVDGLPAAKSMPHRFDLLVQIHRREHIGRPLAKLARALNELADRGSRIALATHPNPIWTQRWDALIGTSSRFTRLATMDRAQWLHTAAASTLVLSDSGGAAEELPYLGIPLAMYRRSVERPEALHTGHARQLDPQAPDMAGAIAAALAWARQAQTPWPRTPDAPYGDGRAAQRAAAAITRYLRTLRAERAPTCVLA